MPQILAFPGCCTARILTGFGDTVTAEYAYRPDGNHLKEGELTQFLQKQIPFLKRAGNVAIIFATTDSDQKQAMKELKDFGFVNTPAVSKKQHFGKNLIGWHYLVGDVVDEKKVVEDKVKAAQQVQAALAAIRGFGMGDRVYIRKGLEFSGEEEGVVGWLDQMVECQGRVGRIIRSNYGLGVHHHLVQVGHVEYWWPERFLIRRN